MKKTNSCGAILSLCTAISLSAGTLLSGCAPQQDAGSSAAAGSNSTSGSSAAGASSKSEGGPGYGFNATGMPITSEVVELRVLYPRTALHGDFDQMWFMDWLEEKTNVRLKFDLVEESGWEEKKALAFASGDYGDIFLAGIQKNDENTYGPQGLLVNAAPYIEQYAPLAVEMYDKYPEIWQEITYPDGAIYIMPSINDSPRDTIRHYPNQINQTWLKNVGMEMPQTLDELYSVLKAFKEKDANGNGDPGDEIPVSSIYKNRFKISILTAVGFVDALHDVIDNQYVYVPGQANYREYLSYMHKLYSEGLLDNEYFSQAPEQLLSKQSSGNVGIMESDPTNIFPAAEQYEQYIGLSPLTSSVSGEKVWTAASGCNRSWGVFAMTNKCKYPEAAVRMIDFFYTTEGSRAVRCGPEYQKQWGGPGGYELLTEDSEHCTAKIYMEDFTGYWAYRQAKLGPTVMPFNSNDLVNDIIVGSDAKNAYLRDVIFDSGCREARRFGYPNVSFTTEEQQKISTYLDLDNYVETMTAKFITGETPLTEWDNYIAELKRLGMEDMAKIRQAAFDRYNAIVRP